MSDNTELKEVTMMDVFPIIIDLFTVAEQNKRIIEGKAPHLMGLSREMRINFGLEYGGVRIILPVQVGDYIALFDNINVVVGTWRPWKKIYLAEPTLKLLEIKADDPSLEPLKRGLTIV